MAARKPATKRISNTKATAKKTAKGRPKATTRKPTRKSSQTMKKRKKATTTRAKVNQRVSLSNPFGVSLPPDMDALKEELYQIGNQIENSQIVKKIEELLQTMEKVMTNEAKKLTQKAKKTVKKAMNSSENKASSKNATRK